MHLEANNVTAFLTFDTLVGLNELTQKWIQPITAGEHDVSSWKCRLEVVE